MPVNSFENYPMSWKPVISDRKGAIYTQLAEQLVKDIRNGLLKPGDKLPPQRELADYLDLHLSTVTRAYKLCEERGLICAKVGQGTFVLSRYQEVSGRPCRSMRRLRCDGCFFWRSYPG